MNFGMDHKTVATTKIPGIDTSANMTSQEAKSSAAGAATAPIGIGVIVGAAVGGAALCLSIGCACALYRSGNCKSLKSQV
jgi:hypothetical protein